MSWVDDVKADGVEFPAANEDIWKEFDIRMPIKRWIMRVADDDLLTLFIPAFPYAIEESGKLKGRNLTLTGSYLSKLNVPGPGVSHIEITELVFPIKPIDYAKFNVSTGFAGVQILLIPRAAALPGSDKILELLTKIAVKLGVEV